MAHFPQTRRRDVVVVGGSIGGFAALRRLLAGIDAEFPATVLAVVHGSRADSSSLLALGARSGLTVKVAEDLMPLAPATAYLAPHDRHLLLGDERVRVLRGPRENNARPSIDTLFRSAAVEYGSRVIGVILSGSMRDGAAGLAAVSRCGGVTIVQDPNDAVSRELPRQALLAGPVDHCVGLARIAPLLEALVREEPPPSAPIPNDLKTEARLAFMAMEDRRRVSHANKPTHFRCPECDGPLWENPEGRLAHFRCDVGHSFGLDTFLSGQSRSLEHALWVAFRTLRERSMVIARLAEEARERGQTVSAISYDQKVRELEEHADAITNAIEAAWEIDENSGSTPEANYVEQDSHQEHDEH